MPKNEEIREGIANRLRTARENAGLSQGQVAKMLGLHRPAISEIEAGRRRVSAEELSQLCKIYDVSPTWVASATSEVANASVELAARELAKLKDEDLDTIMQLLKSLRKAQPKPK